MNPKGYPVAVATFTSLLASRSQDLSWERMPILLLAAFAGFILADACWLIWWAPAWCGGSIAGTSCGCTRLSGLLFIGFG
jgi:hypothetical protein